MHKSVHSGIIEKIKVTMIGTLPPIKGISAYCLELANNLSKRIQIKFISFKKLYPDSLYPGGKVEDETYEFKIVTNQNLEIKRSLTYYNPLSWLLAGVKANGNVIHVHWWTTFLTPIYLVIFLIAKFRAQKIIITAHNILPHESSKVHKILTKMILSFADKIVVHSDVNATQCNEEFKIPIRKIVKIPHGILDFHKDFGISRKEAYKRLNLPLNKKVILYFGNIRPYKGLDTLIEAFSLITKKQKNIVLVIAGKPWENWKKYKELLKRYDLTENARLFLDYVSQKDAGIFFSAADLVVLSYKEFTSQSGVGLLAIPFHTPLIVTNVGGLPELVLDKNYIVPPDDPRLLAEKINLAISNKRLLRKLSNDSRKLANKFSWDIISKNTIEVYEEVLRRE